MHDKVSERFPRDVPHVEVLDGIVTTTRVFTHNIQYFDTVLGQWVYVFCEREMRLVGIMYFTSVACLMIVLGEVVRRDGSVVRDGMWSCSVHDSSGNRSHGSNAVVAAMCFS